MVLAALLGVSAGRFVVEPDSTPFLADFDGSPAEVLKAPIERARRALNSISAGALVGVTRVEIAEPVIAGYLACTPEPARGLLQKIMAGASPRDLITSGAVAPRLLEAVLSDSARRGAIRDVERTGSEPPPPRGSSPTVTEAHAPGASSPSPPREIPSPPAAVNPAETSAQDAGWFSFQLDTGAPAAVAVASPQVPATVPSSPALPAQVVTPMPIVLGLPLQPVLLAPRPDDNGKTRPFSSEMTPAVDRVSDTITEGVFNDSGTLQGLGLPEVGAAAQPMPAPTPEVASPPKSPAPATVSSPVPPPTSPSALPASSTGPPRPAVAIPPAPPERAETPDALASALTQESAEPPPARPLGATQVMATVSLPSSPAVITAASPRESGAAPEGREGAPRSTLTSQAEIKAGDAVAARMSKSGLRSRTVEVVQVPIVKPTRPKAQPNPNSWSGWLVPALLAFAVAYGLVTHFKSELVRLFASPAPSSAPASPR
jgi:hypothetical protein